MRRALVTAALAALVAGCPPTASRAPADAPPPSDSSAAAGAESFRRTADAILDRWLAENPRFGRQVGLHQFDGKVAAYSRAAIAARIEGLGRDREVLAAIDPSGLSPDEALDRAILAQRVELELFNLTDRELFATSPAFYDELFSVSSYIDFDYAPLEQRARKLVEHEEAALGQVDHVLANLRPQLSRPVLETAIKIYRGHAEYLRGDVVRILAGVGDEAFQKRFRAANQALAGKAAAIADALETEYLPRADATSHVLGKERFVRFVAAQEGRALDLAELKRMADADLEMNKQAYLALAGKVTISRPRASELLAAATQLIERAHAFVRDQGLVTIVSDDRAALKETPPYMRWNAAFLNMPGPFDSAREAFYYITLPDPAWPQAEQEAYIFPYGTLMATTVHEVYPGHFLQGLWLRKAPTRVQKMVESYSFVEGWAHYTEQLMIEQGFGKEDPQNHLGQLSDALLRNCRFVVSIGVHAEGMSLEEATRRFEEDCMQDKATAREQAVRATFDPGYFAYTMGKLQILELREALKAELGERFDLRRFHDALLSHGSPPVALIAERVRQELSAVHP